MNVAAGLTADEVITLIVNAIEEMEGVGFLQSSSDHPMVQQKKKRKNLHLNRLYLDTASSFNQSFSDKHLDEVKRVVFALRGKCNARLSHAKKKGWYGDIFNM